MTMPITNRKLLVGSEKLFISNNIVNQLSKDHDIIMFSYDKKKTLEENSRALWRDIAGHIATGYDKVVFLGLGQECNLVYSLYEKRNMSFDGAVFINYKRENEGDLTSLSKERFELSNTKLYTISNSKKLDMFSQNHEQLKWYQTIRAKKLGQIIHSFLVHDTYGETYLEGINTRFVRG